MSNTTSNTEQESEVTMMPATLSEFRNFLESQVNFGLAIRLPMTLDGIDGSLRILKCNTRDGHGAYNVEFVFTRLCCDTLTPFDEFYETFDKMCDGIRQLPGLKILGKNGMLPDDFEKFIMCRKAVYELMDKPIETCYGCMEETFGYKTKCGHDICVKCFIKSVDKQESSFTCGVCRAVEECCN